MFAQSIIPRLWLPCMRSQRNCSLYSGPIISPELVRIIRPPMCTRNPSDRSYTGPIFFHFPANFITRLPYSLPDTGVMLLAKTHIFQHPLTPDSSDRLLIVKTPSRTIPAPVCSPIRHCTAPSSFRRRSVRSNVTCSGWSGMPPPNP